MMPLKEKALSLFFSLVVTTVSFSQQHPTFLYGGIVISKPAYFGNVKTSHATGLGIEFQREHGFSKKFSWTLEAGFTLFTGTYTFPTYSVTSPENSINGYCLAPILGGFRYYGWKQLYVGFEAGMALVSLGAGLDSYPAVVPSVGYKINAEKKHSFDFSLRLLNVIGYPTYPESNNLSAGGYGMWGLKIGYGF